MFVDRESELAKLREEYESPGFRFTVLYGRRRVGKTTLIKEYISDKPHIYFLVTLESMPLLLRRFREIVSAQLDDPLMAQIPFESFGQIFSYLAEKRLDEKLVIVIDEFQYLGKIDDSIPSQFQRIVDEIVRHKEIHLVLCGSIISMMYTQTLSYSSPLYGRRTSSVKLDALRFNHLDAFFPIVPFPSGSSSMPSFTAYRNISNSCATKGISSRVSSATSSTKTPFCTTSPATFCRTR